MIKGKHFLKSISILLILSLVISLSGCIAVDNSSKNVSENVETEYRHIKNTYHNYINSGSSSLNTNTNNDSSDYEEPDDSEFVPDDLNPDIGKEDNSDNKEEEDDLPPDINYDDVTVAPTTNIFSDSFEKYGENGTYIVKYYMDGGDNCEAFVHGDAVEGNHSGRFARTLGKSNWASIYYIFSEDSDDYDFQNWNDQKYISFWAKSDGSLQAMSIGVFDYVHESWCKVQLTNEWTFYSIELSDFLDKDFIMDQVTQIGFSWGGGTQECYIDDIRVTETEIKNYNKYIPAGDPNVVENGEFYQGVDIAVKEAYSLFEGDKYSTTAEESLDSTVKKSGNYSIKFTAKPESGKDAAVYNAKLGQNMFVSSFNEVKLNLKGDGSANQKVNVMLYDGNTQIADVTFDITSNWAEYLVPVVIPANSTNVKFDRIILATALSNSDRVFYLDDFVIANKSGVTATPADVIENGEFYSDTFKVTDAYIADTALPVTTVELDSTTKIEGNNSVKFNLPIGGVGVQQPVPEKTYIQEDLQVTATLAGATTEKTFDTPIDCSGSDGKLIVTGSEANSNKITYYLEIYTANKKSEKYFKSASVTTKDIVIPFTELGLTDNDLKAVTGYKIQIYYKGASRKYTFSIYTQEHVDILDEYSSVLTYELQTKSVSEDKHFKLKLRGDGKSETQTVKIDLYATSGYLVASQEVTFESDGNWQDVYLKNTLGISTNVKTLKITFKLTDAKRELWLDDFVIILPEKPVYTNPDVIDDFEPYTIIYPVSEYFTYELSTGYDTKMSATITDGSDEYGEVRNGKQALKLSSGDYTKGGIHYGTAYQSFEDRNVVLNEGDKVSLWVALTRASATEVKINIQTTNGQTGWQKINLKDTDWHELEFEVSASATGKITKIWYFMLNSTGAQTTYCVDDFTITRK